MRIYNISNLANPELLFDDDVSNLASEIEIQGNLVYTMDPNLGLDIWNISDPTNTHKIGSHHCGGNSYSLLIDGNLAYVGADQGLFEVLDISDPTNIQVVFSDNHWGECRDFLLVEDIFRSYRVFEDM